MPQESPYRPTALAYPLEAHQLEGLNDTIDDIYGWLQKIRAEAAAAPPGPTGPAGADGGALTIYVQLTEPIGAIAGDVWVVE